MYGGTPLLGGLNTALVAEQLVVAQNFLFWSLCNKFLLSGAPQNVLAFQSEAFLAKF